MPDYVATANTAWVQTYTGGPYTSFKMVEYLLGKAGASYDDLVANPKVLKQVTEDHIAADDMNGGLRYTWASKTGRCTSFAIKVAMQLQTWYPDVFQFEIYDLKGHRVARCQNTGILIDSSSWHGAIALKEGEWKSWDDSDAKWKWIKGKSKFETSRGRKVSSAILSSKQAMTVCLKEVASRATVITLFRSFSNGRVLYHGMVVWLFNKKRLELVPALEHRDQKFVIVWGKGGTERDDAACVYTLTQFLMGYGGPHVQEQWDADNIQSINSQIWDAANNQWGYPIFTKEG